MTATRNSSPNFLSDIVRCSPNAVNRTVREYLAELEQENPVEPPVPQPDQVSTTDPDSTFATKGRPARLGYYNNYLVDNSSCVIVGVQATPARSSHESLAARQMIELAPRRTKSAILRNRLYLLKNSPWQT